MTKDVFPVGVSVTDVLSGVLTPRNVTAATADVRPRCPLPTALLPDLLPQRLLPTRTDDQHPGVRAGVHARTAQRARRVPALRQRRLAHTGPPTSPPATSSTPSASPPSTYTTSARPPLPPARRQSRHPRPRPPHSDKPPDLLRTRTHPINHPNPGRNTKIIILRPQIRRRHNRRYRPLLHPGRLITCGRDGPTNMQPIRIRRGPHRSTSRAVDLAQ